MKIHYHGREYTLRHFTRKAVRKVMGYGTRRRQKAYDEWARQQVLRVMRGGADAREERILKKYLARTLQRAYAHVPYWSEFKQLGTVTDENAFEVLQTLPLLDKDTIREQGEARMLRRDVVPEDLGAGLTGGTTGRPLTFYYGRPAEFSHQTALYEYMTGHPYAGRFDQPGAIASLGGTRPPAEAVERGEFWSTCQPNIYGSMDFCTLYMQEQNLAAFIQEFNTVQPKIYRGYSNALLKLAKHMLRTGGAFDLQTGRHLCHERVLQ